jgi:hypothetical protein
LSFCSETLESLGRSLGNKTKLWFVIWDNFWGDVFNNSLKDKVTQSLSWQSNSISCKA